MGEVGQFEGMKNDVVSKYTTFIAKSHPGVEVLAVTGGGAAQGGVMGFILGKMGNIQPPAGANAPPPMMLAPGGNPWVLSRNFAALTGVTAGLTLVIKKYRKGVEDWKGSAMASFGGGAAFSISSNLGAPKGLPPMPGMPMPSTTPMGIMGDAVRTGLAFAVIQAAFYAIGEKFSGGKADPVEDVHYAACKSMLTQLGLEQYEKNFKKGQLTDQTLMLLTEGTLTEVKIPPGPRLLILNHTSQARYQAEKHSGKKGPSIGALSLALPVEIAEY